MQTQEMAPYSRLGFSLPLPFSTAQESHTASAENLLEESPLAEKLLALLDFVFGCHHSNLSRVFTLGGQTYRVCCGCGAKFEYSLRGMRIERRMSVLATQTIPPFEDQSPDHIHPKEWLHGAV
jgi:hypothetical protein